MGGRRVDAAHRSKVPYWAHDFREHQRWLVTSGRALDGDPVVPLVYRTSPINAQPANRPVSPAAGCKAHIGRPPVMSRKALGTRVEVEGRLPAAQVPGGSVAGTTA